MIETIILFFVGFLFLIKGADVMVDGSSSIAKKLGISNIAIGLTVVAFGTSAPELIVSALAAFKGNTGVALGNIIGSSISNTLLILGVSALICPLLVKRNTVNKEIPLSLLAVVAVYVLVNDVALNGQNATILSRADGIILILFFSIFIYYTFGISRDIVEEKESLASKLVNRAKGHEQIEIVSGFKSGLMIVFGFLGLALGGHWIVNGAVEFAAYYGFSEALIGLTIVAIGTSLPELAASAMAAKKGETDIAVGNVVGSNIFNMLWVLGLSGIIRPIAYNPLLNVDMMMLFLITIMLMFLVYVGKKNVVGRAEGIILLMFYVAYIVFLIIRG